MICYKKWEIDSLNKNLLNSGNVPGFVHHTNKGQVDFTVVRVALLYHQHRLGGPADWGASVFYNDSLMIERKEWWSLPWIITILCWDTCQTFLWPFLNSTEWRYMHNPLQSETPGGKIWYFGKQRHDLFFHGICPQWSYSLIPFQLVILVLNVILNGVNIQTSVESTNVKIQSQYAFKALVASGYLELRIVWVQSTWIQKRLQILSSSPKGKAIISRIPDIYAISLRS